MSLLNDNHTGNKHRIRWRLRLHEIIFEADTYWGKFFDVVLIFCIFCSVLTVMLDSVRSINAVYGAYLLAAEYFFTLLFTIEYLLRLYCIARPIAYATSFFGIIDLLAILPTYISFLIPGAQYLLVIRILRVLRVFRVLKMAQYVSESNVLLRALRSSRRKIFVFMYSVLMIVVVLGSVMYLIEGIEGGFTSIPQSVYWAIVTLTTVGYGDMAPQTAAGKALACLIMILGYGVIAVPTGIVTAELAYPRGRTISTQSCPHCSAEGHENDALFCKQCGGKLNE